MGLSQRATSTLPRRSSGYRSEAGRVAYVLDSQCIQHHKPDDSHEGASNGTADDVACVVNAHANPAGGNDQGKRVKQKCPRPRGEVREHEGRKESR